MGHDLPLVASSALVVLGMVFNVFALIAFSFHMDSSMAWTFGLFGTGMWLLAVALFFFFMTDPQPKHSRRR